MKKRPFLLLEVLIAFAIVAICILPLLAPHLWIIQGEKAFLAEIQADRVAGNLFGELIQKLHENEIPFELLLDNRRNEINAKLNIPYKVSWSSQIERDKKGQTDNQHFYLLRLSLLMEPLDLRKELKFDHLIFVERNLAFGEEGSAEIKEFIPSNNELPVGFDRQFPNFENLDDIMEKYRGGQ